jgi:hypothetical protein
MSEGLSDDPPLESVGVLGVDPEDPKIDRFMSDLI